MIWLLAAFPHAARADWSLGAEAGVRHDNNVGNAQMRSDIVQDTISSARLSIFQLVPLPGSYSVTLGADLAGESFNRLHGLSNASLDADIGLKRKFGLGALAPWVRAGLSVARFDYDASYRNAWVYRASLAAGRRVNERLNLWAEYAFERRAAGDQEVEVPGLSSDAFSEASHRLGANAEFALSENTFLVLGALYRRGDVISTTAGSAQIYYASRAIAEDPAFGEDFYAYRIHGTTYGLRVGLSYAPGAHSAIGCAFARYETHADGGNNYTKSLPEITWNYRF